MGHKRKSFSQFATGHLAAIRVLRKFGLLRNSRETREKRAWGVLLGKERSFRNIAEHCIVVGVVTDIILERLCLEGHLTSKQRRDGALAAILHDSTKRWELQVGLGVEQKSTETPVLSQRRKEIVSVLCDMFAVPKSTRRLLSLCKYSGNGAYLFKLSQVQPLISPTAIVQWVIFLVDHMVAHTTLVNPESRVRKIIDNGAYSTEINYFYKKLFGEVPSEESSKEAFEKVYGRLIPFFSKVETDLQRAMRIEVSIIDFVQGEISRRCGGSVC